MFTETLEQENDVIGIACEGKLNRDDLKRIDALVKERLVGRIKPGLLVDLTHFEGYEDFDALRKDIEVDLEHRDHFSRIAVLTDTTWVEWGTKLAGLATPADVRVFEPKDRKAATEWAKNG